MKVQVDLALARPGRPAALDVDHVRPVENRHVDGEPGCVAEGLQVRNRDLTDVHRVDRRKAQVEDARAEPVALRLRVLLEVAEGRQRRDVAMRGASTQAELARELADADRRSVGPEGREDREATFERLRPRGLPGRIGSCHRASDASTFQTSGQSVSTCGTGPPERGCTEMPELYEIGALELVRHVRAREVSRRQVLEAHLDRIDAVNGVVNAVVERVDRDAALAAAEAADRDHEACTALTLDGVAVSIKDHFDVEGMLHTEGVRSFADRRSPRELGVVQRLLDAGALVVGKCNQPDFQIRWNTVNDLYGATLNPRDTTRTAGGSSGGDAAAVATGMAASGSAPTTAARSACRKLLRELRPSSFGGPRAPRPGARPEQGGMTLDLMNSPGPFARTLDDSGRRSSRSPDRTRAIRRAFPSCARAGHRKGRRPRCSGCHARGCDRRARSRAGARPRLRRAGAAVPRRRRRDPERRPRTGALGRAGRHRAAPLGAAFLGRPDRREQPAAHRGQFGLFDSATASPRGPARSSSGEGPLRRPRS